MHSWFRVLTDLSLEGVGHVSTEATRVLAYIIQNSVLEKLHCLKDILFEFKAGFNFLSMSVSLTILFGIYKHHELEKIPIAIKFSIQVHLMCQQLEKKEIPFACIHC